MALFWIYYKMKNQLSMIQRYGVLITFCCVTIAIYSFIHWGESGMTIHRATQSSHVSQNITELKRGSKEYKTSESNITNQSLSSEEKKTLMSGKFNVPDSYASVDVNDSIKLAVEENQKITELKRGSKQYKTSESNITNQSFSSEEKKTLMSGKFNVLDYNASVDVNDSIKLAVEKKFTLLRRILPYTLAVWIEERKMIKILKGRKKKKVVQKLSEIKLIQSSNLTNKPKGISTVPKKQSCAVIGNGGILLYSSCGSEIDSHDFVMRSNMAPITGFEKDVGYRNDFVSLNAELSRNFISCLDKTSRNCSAKMLDRFRVYNKSILWLSKMPVMQRSYRRVISLLDKNNVHPKIAYPFTRIADFIKRIWRIPHPSSGLFLYTVAASMCESVSLYGFYPFYTSSDGTLLKHHYYEDIAFNYSTTHRMPEEFQMFALFQKLGYIRLVTDTCLREKHTSI